MSRLHLLPVPLSGAGIDQLSSESLAASRNLRHFLVEKSKTARSYLKSIAHPLPQSELEIRELNESDLQEDLAWLKELVSQNLEIGLLSEAGLPCVADPGYNIVRYAHQNNIDVVPYSGPNSMIMALMASGLNGQEFCFHGYLPRKKDELRVKINDLINLCNKSSMTHIFMETPYRNISLLETLLQHFPSDFLLSISCHLGNTNQKIKTMKINQWKNINIEYLNDAPSIFLIQKS